MKQRTHMWPSVCSSVFVNKEETVRSPLGIWTFHCISLQSHKIHKKINKINVCFHANSFLELVEKADTAFNFKCAVGLSCKNKIWAWSNWVQTVNSQKKAAKTGWGSQPGVIQGKQNPPRGIIVHLAHPSTYLHIKTLLLFFCLISVPSKSVFFFPVCGRKKKALFIPKHNIEGFLNNLETDEWLMSLIHFVPGNKSNTGQLTLIVLVRCRGVFFSVCFFSPWNNRASSLMMRTERFVERYCLPQDRWRRAVLNLQSTQVLEGWFKEIVGEI